MEEEEEIVSLFDDDVKPVDKAVEKEEAPKDKAPEFEIPEKFVGKSVEEVVASYVNLEKEAGRRANEVGELRQLTDSILQQQVAQGQQVAEEEHEELGFDDFVDDPAEAVGRALDQNPRLQALEQGLLDRNREVAHERLVEAHADADTVVASNEFQSWVQESASRSRSFQRADVELDTDAAVDLLSLYKQTKRVSTEEAEAERDAIAAADLKKATLETGGVKSSNPRMYRRADLIRLKMQDPARYSAMSDEIVKAYAEKRVK